MPTHFHTGYYPDKNIAIRAGIRKLLELSVTAGYTDAKIWFPVKTNVETILKPHISAAELKQFQKGSLRLDTVTVHLATPKLVSYLRGPTLALFPDAQQLHSLAADAHTTDLIFVTWMEEWLATYLTTYPDSTYIPPVADEVA